MPGLGDFIARRKPDWERLQHLVERSGRYPGFRRLTAAEQRAFGPLYRQAVADLAHARLRGGDDSLMTYLNDLVIQAHGLLYAERQPGSARLWRFLAAGFPRLLYRRRVFIVLAALTFWIGTGVSAGLTARDPRAAKVFLGAFGDRDEDVSFYRDLPERMRDGERPGEAAFLMTHNTQVAIVAFGLGILGGLPTVLFLFYNGVPIGAIAVAQQRAGYGLDFWSFVAPHGVPELTAIFIAGGAGMCIGWALIAPGEYRRADAIRRAGRDAVRMLLGSGALFIIAGFTESFVSPTALPASSKFAYAAFMAIALTAYLRLGVPSPSERASTGH
jgi:uncharacterized membrane protein SpoIIM required for sporulation